MTALPPCNTCGGIEYHWARYTQARMIAGSASYTTAGFAVDEARRFYQTHVADPRWTPDAFDRDAMQWLDGDVPLRVPDIAGPGPGSLPDARRTAGQTHDGYHPGQPCCAPLFNAGDRVRVGDDPFYVSLGGRHLPHLVATLVGAECRVAAGPDREGDYRLLTDSLAPAWVHGSCLTKIEEAEA